MVSNRTYLVRETEVHIAQLAAQVIQAFIKYKKYDVKKNFIGAYK